MILATKKQWGIRVPRTFILRWALLWPAPFWSPQWPWIILSASRMSALVDRIHNAFVLGAVKLDWGDCVIISVFQSGLYGR